jgi:DNA primase
LNPARFTIRTAIARTRDVDPWRDYWKARQKLPIR